MTVLYGSSVADSTLTTASDMATASGGVETTATSTTDGNAGNFCEVFSRAGTTPDQTAIPATYSGKGWVYAPGAGTFALGNWSAIVNIAAAFNVATATLTIRFAKYSGGIYAAIGQIVWSGAITTGATKQQVSPTASSMPATTFGATDLLYIDAWFSDATGVSGDNPVIYESTSATAGVANDVQITTSTFTPLVVGGGGGGPDSFFGYRYGIGAFGHPVLLRPAYATRALGATVSLARGLATTGAETKFIETVREGYLGAYAGRPLGAPIPLPPPGQARAESVVSIGEKPVSRSDFSISAVLRPLTRSKFLVSLGQSIKQRSKFLISSGLKLVTRSRFLVSSALKLASRSKFLISQAIKPVQRSKFVVSLSEKLLARSKYLISLGEKPAARSKFLVTTVLKPISRSKFLIALFEKLLSRSKFLISLGERAAARSKFLISLVEKPLAQSKFLVSLSEKLLAQSRFLISSGLNAISQSKFLIGVGQVFGAARNFIAGPFRPPTPIRTRWATRALGSTVPLPRGLATGGSTTKYLISVGEKSIERSKFVVSSGLKPASRSKFVTALGIRSAARGRFLISLITRAVFRVRFLVSLSESIKQRAKFLISHGIKPASRSKFLVRLSFLYRARSRFWIRLPQIAVQRAKFLVSIAEKPKNRAKYAISTGIFPVLRSKFLISATLITRPIKSVGHFVVQSLNLTEQVKPLLALVESVRSVLQTAWKTLGFLSLSSVHIQSLTVTHQGIAMPAPNSTILSTITVTDVSGAAVSNASAVSVVVYFPDGTTTTYSLGSGITNIGNGQYQAKYNTKSSGIVREVWSVVAADGVTLASEQFEVGVGY